MNCDKISNDYLEDDFVKLYEKYENNSYNFLIDYLIEKTNINENYKLNIMIGCTNTSETDYERFKESNEYSFYINVNIYEIEITKQYNMFTIDYNDIDDRFPENIISNIHFDTGVSNFAPIKYLDIAQKILKSGGKLVFDVFEHGGIPLIYKYPDKLFKIEENICMTKEEINEIETSMKIKIDFENEIINANGDFYDNCEINPQIFLLILNNLDYNKKFKKSIYEEYLYYYRDKYPLMLFEEKECTFMNYSYPVTMRVINKDTQEIDIYDKVINTIVNEIMNIDEKIEYINTGNIQLEKIFELEERIIDNKELENKMTNKKDCTIHDLLWNGFTSKIKYVECIKL